MMTRRGANAALLGGLALAAMHGADASAQQKTVQLPPPQTDGGKPLMQALKQRRTSRMFSDRALPPPVLSNLLWAAWGINRPESGLRTAPSWRGWAHVDLYLAMADGTWIYDAKGHRLMLHMPDDLRAETTTEQPFVKTAPLNIIYVSDGNKMKDIAGESRTIAGVADTAMIGQNVYLFCASEGLACVIRGLVPREKLAQRLKLPLYKEGPHAGDDEHTRLSAALYCRLAAPLASRKPAFSERAGFDRDVAPNGHRNGRA